ncbi:MAG: serine protease [Pirellulaceae bacterium]|nr:MAG: serine protease [Pirellulaceae bacterium]
MHSELTFKQDGRHHPRRTPSVSTSVAVVACGLLPCFGILTAPAACQSPPPPPSSQQVAASGPDGNDKTELVSFLQTQVSLLESPSYRERQQAYWHLQRHPIATLRVIEASLPGASLEVGSRLVELLTEFALSDSVAVSDGATALLQSSAQQLTSIGQLANNALSSMADIQEQRAIDLLVLHGARIGPRNFGMNGQFSPIGELALTIDETFTGDESVVYRIKYLKSIETVFLAGSAIGRTHFEAVAQLKQLRNLKLKHVTIDREELRLLRDLTNLEHLGINYVDIDDSYVDVLLELPMSQSLRLYGTSISDAGAERLRQQLDGLEITCLRGGFLGVGTELLSNTVVDRVTPGSAADEAGLLPGDELTHIQGEPIKTFMDLRQELGKFVAGEEVTIRFKRGQQEMEVVARLKEEPDLPR